MRSRVIKSDFCPVAFELELLLLCSVPHPPLSDWIIASVRFILFKTLCHWKRVIKLGVIIKSAHRHSRIVMVGRKSFSNPLSLSKLIVSVMMNNWN